MAGPDLKMHAADEASPRARVVVLDEVVGDPDRAVAVANVRFLEEPTLVSVNGRREQDRAIEPRLEPVQSHRCGQNAPRPRRTAVAVAARIRMSLRSE